MTKKLPDIAENSPRLYLPTESNNRVERRNSAIHVMYVRLLCAYMREFGFDPMPMLEAVGIRPEYLDQPHRLLGLDQIIALHDIIGNHTCPYNMLLEMVSRMDTGMFGAVSIAWSTAPTIRVAMCRIAGYLRLYNRAVLHEFSEDASGGHFRLHEWTPLGNAREAILDGVLLGQIMMLKKLTGSSLSDLEIDIAHPAQDGHKNFSRFFPWNLTFDRPIATIHLPTHLLDQPCIAADPVAYEAACRQCDQLLKEQGSSNILHRVRATFRMIDIEKVSLDLVASALAMSPRTLMRKLSSEGKTYKGMLDDYHKDLALWWLQNTDLPLNTIALKLGFADDTNFSRICRRWFGEAPSVVRESLRGKSPDPIVTKDSEPA